MKTNSQNIRITLWSRIKYLAWLFIKNLNRVPLTADYCVQDLAGVVEKFENFTQMKSQECTFLEIGFGARPHRAYAAQYYFKSVHAVDLDHPLMSARDFSKVWRHNGFLRAMKALVRQVIFDKGEWRAFHARMEILMPSYRPSGTKLMVGNAGSSDFWAKESGPYDLVFSTDVFEHIPLEDLKRAMEGIRRTLTPGGICITYPMVFTGIMGGHVPKWYGFSNAEPERNPGGAWEHLINPNFSVDTYLNQMTRREYVKLFSDCGFTILSDRSMSERVGEHLMTQELRESLSVWDDYELYSNRVEFILKAK